MKKIFLYLTAALAVFSVFHSCVKPEPEPEYPNEAMAKVSQANLIDAAAAAYAVWEDETVIPATLSVEGEAITKAGTLELTLPQYQYALAKVLCDLKEGKSDDVIVMGYKPADHPDRDSYDKAEIAVTGGPEITEGTEDLADLAKRFIATAAEKGTIPNQTLVTRKGESALAFSTNRLTVSLLRALADYKKGKALPKNVSTDYLSAAATLKGFAQQFVGILDIWENTVGTVSADGSHCTDNGSAWQDVHFVPIPHSGGAYADGVDQYDAKYQPYFTVTIDGTTYTSAQTWGIALRGIMDLITKEGSAKLQENRNPMEHTLGNGASLKEPIPAVTENDIWGQYPWYESTNDGPAINQSQFSPYLIVRCAAWFLTRQVALGKIGNYQFFGTDPDNGFVDEGISGFVSSMRMWLIAARFYKYLLDNGIEENVYDAVKDVKFDTDLYGVEMPDIELKTKKVSLKADGTAVEAKFMAKKAWTATATESWIRVEPASGDASDAAIVAISAEPNEGEERSGVVLIKGGNVTDGLEIAVTQAAYVPPVAATLKDFATEFVKGLDVWEATVGNVDADGERNSQSAKGAWVDVHYIPIGNSNNSDFKDYGNNQYDDGREPWTLHVNDVEYTSSQAWEIAIRGLMNMVTAEGEAFLDGMTDRNLPYTLKNNGTLNDPVPAASPDNKWGKNPWYEFDDLVKYNGQDIADVDVNFIVKVGAWHVVRSFIAVGSNSPLGMIGNFQQFGTASSTLILEGYEGLISPMRELLVLMRIYKYILDNGIESNVYDAIKDQKFDFDLYGIGVPEKPKPTIAEFAKEFAKVADKWDNNIGTVSYTREGTEYKYTNVHFVPDNFVITLNGINYDKNQMHEMAMRSLKALEAGGSFTDEVPEPGSYTPATSPYHEYDDPLQETEAGLDLLSNFATRCLNYLANNGEWPNVCSYPRTTDPVLTSYHGYVCVERNMLMLARLCREIVNKGLTDMSEIAKLKVDTELFGSAPSVTIKDFAQEYVKILDIWQKTVGEVVMHPDVPEETVAEAHYVPSNTTFTLGGKTYNTADMWETALRSYLLLRGYDGLETEKYGKNSIPALEGGAVSMSTTEVPPTHDYYWGSAPFNETKGNGGHLVMGTAEENVHCQVRTDILDNWAMRSLNFQHGQSITNLCGYANGQLDGYYGCFCSQRALLTYAFFFKYMLDNGFDKGTDVPDSAIIRSELLGDEGSSVEEPSLKDFAKEFVKGLEVWENTVGNVDADGIRNQGSAEGAWINVHFIPIVGNPSGDYYNYGNNQYDPKYTPWTLNVKGTEYSSSQAWEIAIRGLLDMATKEGNDFLASMDDRNKPYTLQDGLALSKAPIRQPSPDNKWGKNPWYEYDDLVKYNGQDISEVDVNFILKVGAWHVVRSFIAVGSNSPLGMIGNFQQFGTASSTLILDGYVGLISPMRELLVLMRIYKYLLDNDIDSNVYSAIKDKKFDFDLYNQEAAAETNIAIDGNLSEWDAVEGVEAGSFKEFKYASDKDNVYFYFKIKRSKIIAGKTEPFEFNWRRYIAFGIDTDNNAETGAAVTYAGMNIPGCEAGGNFYPFRGNASEASGTDGVQIVNGVEEQGGISTEITSSVPDGAADKVTVYGQVDDDFVYLESKFARSAIGSPAAGTAKIQLSLSWDLTEIMDLKLN